MEVPASFVETVRTYMGQRVQIKGESKYAASWTVIMVALSIDGSTVLVVRDRNDPSKCAHLSVAEVVIAADPEAK